MKTKAWDGPGRLTWLIFLAASASLGFESSIFGPQAVRHNRIIEIRGLQVPSKLQLLAIAHAGDALRLGLGLGQRRQKHARQDRDKGDHYEQFDQCKTASSGGLVGHLFQNDLRVRELPIS